MELGTKPYGIDAAAARETQKSDPVSRARAERLVSARLITQQQFDTFMREGALGSHLENLQRHGGFKGFNQKSVSVVIAATDPRKKHFEPAVAA